MDRTGAVLATLGALLLVALTEISRLSGQQLDLEARSWSFESLMGPARLLDRSTEGWAALRALDQSPEVPFPVGGWLTAYVSLDLVLIVTYYALAYRVLATRHRPALRLVGLAALADLVENALAAVAWPLAPGATAPWLVAASALKWLFLVLVVLVLLRRLLAFGDDSWRRVLRRWGRAVYTQRFSVLPLLPLVVLGWCPARTCSTSCRTSSGAGSRATRATAWPPAWRSRSSRRPSWPPAGCAPTTRGGGSRAGARTTRGRSRWSASGSSPRG